MQKWQKDLKLANKTWSKLLAECKANHVTVNSLLYDTVTKLRFVYDDLDFREDCQSKGQDALTRLRKTFEYGSLTILHLFDILEHFPKKTQWTSSSIHDLHQETFQKKYAQSLEKRQQRQQKKVKTQPTTSILQSPKQAKTEVKNLHRTTLEQFAIKKMTEGELLDIACLAILEAGLEVDKRLSDYIQQNYVLT
jgi:hypothetical protein